MIRETTAYNFDLLKVDINVNYFRIPQCYEEENFIF